MIRAGWKKCWKAFLHKLNCSRSAGRYLVHKQTVKKSLRFYRGIFCINALPIPPILIGDECQGVLNTASRFWASSAPNGAVKKRHRSVPFWSPVFSRGISVLSSPGLEAFFMYRRRFRLLSAVYRARLQIRHTSGQEISYPVWNEALCNRGNGQMPNCKTEIGKFFLWISNRRKQRADTFAAALL